MSPIESKVQRLFVAATAVLGSQLVWADKEMLYCLHLEGDAANSGTGNAAITTSGTPTWETNKGQFDGNQSVKGTNGGYIIADTNGIRSMADGWTLSFWVNSNGMGNWGDVCGFKIGDICYKVEKTDSDAYQIYYKTGETTVANALDNPISFTPNQWMNIVFVAKAENSLAVYAALLHYPKKEGLYCKL